MDAAERRVVVDRWFRLYAGRVLPYLLHRTDPHTAQDVLQEVFVTAFIKFDRVPDPPIGWLFGTARRLLANRYRGTRRHDALIERLLDEVGSIEDEPQADQYDLKLAFAQTMATLATGDREVLTLTGWYGLTPTQAAEALGCSSSAYAVRLHRARKRLGVALEEAGYHGDTPAGRFARALRGQHAGGGA
ncbi:MAG TPA: RNA polymerase sigma factor [Jatrophihabitans sp.]|jgi:RNA polymerase sigma-70 factor (ECF subfamily)